MPRVRYVLKDDATGEIFREEDIIQRDAPLEERINVQLSKRLPDSKWTLLNIEITNIWEHEHTWEIIAHHQKTSSGDWLECIVCHARATRYPGRAVKMNEDYRDPKFEVCREIPKKLKDRPRFKFPDPPSGPKFA